MGSNTIDAKMLSKMFLAGAKNLESKKEWINELNVFPVPDGDTGTNMTMTIMSAAKEVSALSENADMESICKAISSGSLRGARGNSGVILSQLFRGFTKGIRDCEEIGIPVFASAFERAVETAYKAVMKPKEGTILTVAKGVADKAMEYLVSKGMINAAYGMMVTAIIRDEYLYDNDEGWEKIAADVSSQLDNYNSNFNRFLYYGWGVWVTAHARHNLFSAIIEFGEDYLYSDTDSVKGINFQDHLGYFNRYNNAVFDKLLKMCNHYNIPFERTHPLDKMIGVWDIEDGYIWFRSAGAKRYIYENTDHSLGLTCAGINKKMALPYLLYEYGGGKELEDEAHQLLEDYNTPLLKRDPCAFIKVARIAYAEKKGTWWKEAKQWLIDKRLNSQLYYEPIFYIFKEGLYIPPEHTGKLTLDYIDRPLKAVLTDFFGNPAVVEEYSAVYMEPQHYYMSQAADYLRLLSGIRQEVY